MSGTKSSGGQSSKGFLHWLKNTWLGKLWNWIVSCFRPEQEETEPGSASKKEVVVASDDNESKSPEVGQEKDRESSQSREKVREDVQKEDSDLPQTPINSKPPTMSRSSSKASLSKYNNLEPDSEQVINGQLEFDDCEISQTSFCQKAQEPSSQLERKPDSSDTKGEKGNRKRKNDSETNDIPYKISKKEDRIKKKAHRNQTPNPNLSGSSSSSTLSNSQKH
ncbi:hypothetical protein [Candidatus Mesenet endosymbiont of Phosphuga atrata]|uniref:hypothetical protein n=1 Tax=Candidatus Mesenet endosymbiont of Phosphuga atrata TaxID=3066221 RepID=UPI0030CC95C1